MVSFFVVIIQDLELELEEIALVANILRQRVGIKLKLLLEIKNEITLILESRDIILLKVEK